MNKNDCFSLGYITKLHGYKGSLVFYLDVDNPSDYTEMESVLVDLDNKLIPFSINKLELKPGSNNAVVSLKDISSSDQASRLIKKELFLPLSSLPKLDEKNFYFHEVIGFIVEDRTLGKVGSIINVIDLPNNPLLNVKGEESQEILIPAIDQFIVKVLRKEKILQVDLPEGLIELYTNSKDSY